MIDHHQVRRLRRPPRFHHMALGKVRTLGAQAVVRRGGDRRQYRIVVADRTQLGNLPGAGAMRPLVHRSQPVTPHPAARIELRLAQPV
jgi:hypothetical protein